MEKSKANKDTDSESCVSISGIRSSRSHMMKHSSKPPNNLCCLMLIKSTKKRNTLDLFPMSTPMELLLNSVTISRVFSRKINSNSQELISKYQTSDKVSKSTSAKSRKAILDSP